MCEIAVLDPERTDVEIADQLLYRFHEEQGDGVGMLAIHNEGDKFSYDVFKSVEPSWIKFHKRLEQAWEDGAWRVVLHGRAGTSGKKNRECAHPIHIDCPNCEFDWVVHNGSVRNHRNKRQGYVSQGHVLTTDVDTELIPHEIQTLPSDLDDVKSSTYDVYGNLNYLVFSEDGIFCRFYTKYQVTDDFRVTCKLSELSEHGFSSGDDIGWALLTPSEGEPEIETEESSHSYTSKNTQRSTRRGATSYNGTTYDAQDYRDETQSASEGEESDSDGTASPATVTYEDLIPEYEFLNAYKVAPGVVRVVNEERGEESFIRKEKRPKVYYFYVNEEAPEKDVLNVMQKIAREIDNPVETAILKYRRGDEPDDPDEIATAMEAEMQRATFEGMSKAVEDDDIQVQLSDVAEMFDEDGNLIPANEV